MNCCAIRLDKTGKKWYYNTGRRQPSEKRKKPSSAKDGNERDVFSVYTEIITQPGAKVKTSADSITADLQKWAEKRVKKRDIADKMAAAGYIRRAFAMRNCGSQMAIQYCEHCGLHRIRSTNLCRDRLCPVCRWRLAIKRYAEMVQVCDIAKTEYPTNRYFFLTLTIRSFWMDPCSEETRSNLLRGIRKQSTVHIMLFLIFQLRKESERERIT